MRFPVGAIVRPINRRGKEKLYRILDNEDQAVTCWHCTERGCLELESVALVGTDLLVRDVSEHELELVEAKVEIPLDVEMSVAEAMVLFDRRG